MDARPVSNTLRRMTGGAALAEMLKLAGAGPIFGMGGFQLLPFYEACRALGLSHVLINDERCGAFAADAYARVTNRPGMCDGTLGPGATNLTTGLIEALNAGMPLIAIAGGANRQHAWKNMTQEARQFEILRPAVKEAIRIEVTARIPELVRRAFAVATSGRPGPVLIEVPEDVAHGEHDFDAAEFWLDPGTLKAQARRTRPDPDLLAAAGRLLAEADRPLILAGGGVHLSEAYDALRTLAEAEGIPVAHTMSGKGAIPCTHALSAGLFGRYDRIANALIAESDCLLVVGCKLGEIATKRFALIPPGKRLIHVDILPEEIGRTTRADVALAADARLALADLAAFLGDGAGRLRRRAEWVASVPKRMARWREGARERLESTERPINVGRLMGALNRVLPADAVLVADGGFAAHWGGLFFDTKQAGRAFVPDRGFASIGYGVPGGIGAQLGVGPQRRVVALTGDGGFNMSMGELETARRLGAAIVVCIFNNAASGYVKALQHAVFGPGNYQSSDLAEMDYAAVARAMGCHGIRIEDPEALEGALREGLANTTSPTVLDIVVTRDPARMLPGVDNRTLTVQKGDRPV
ncbi:thiamine pyrophosphate-binding protein [Elioraea sp. Yellowstone]|jgi:acetolactate synthase-1/2/3 large subunit|uniref:thiamine pyrophosphate-binding protein n=1 Tax=Elioraea sp. Yellowstone TaxID=2592070 RepID=UPI0011503961|nr:thiamine pyrophosphate-binding protein [Elioraea sp. Yellowstone]TQF77982.1 thiamine pyrophosphate-binding protein [Elioraea sp. Yellowstone]